MGVQSTSEAVTLRQVLACIQDELTDLGDRADGLQAVIGAVVSQPAVVLDAASQTELQAADALSQRLGRLGQLVQVLGGADTDLDRPLGSGDDLAIAISRLGCGAPVDTTGAQGDCDFF